MIGFSAILLALSIQSQNDLRAYGIYRVTADSARVQQFVKEMADWEGGYQFRSEADGEMTTVIFAAHPERTAQQSRQFILGAMQLGMQPEIESYIEAEFYPEQRDDLDQIAKGCGVDPAIAFIAPGEALYLGGPAIRGASYESVECFLEDLKPFYDNFDSIGFIGNEATVEESN